METLTYEIDKEFKVRKIVIENLPKSVLKKIKVTTHMEYTPVKRGSDGRQNIRESL